MYSIFINSRRFLCTVLHVVLLIRLWSSVKSSVYLHTAVAVLDLVLKLEDLYSSVMCFYRERCNAGT